MLSITAVSAGAIDYLLRGSGCVDPDHGSQVAEEADQRAGVGYLIDSDAHDDHRDLTSGRWFGSGLTMVGIEEGERAREADVRAVFGELRHPESTPEDPVFLGRPPRRFRPLETRIGAACALEPDADAERRAEIANQVRADQRKAVAYYDLTFSPVKSVSVYWAALLAAGRTQDAEQVVRAHTEAISEAMGWAEGQVSWTRVGYHGRTAAGRSVGRYEAGEGLVWTRWDHHTNRACEPQLHAHVAVLNRVITGTDGQVRALDGRGFRAVKHGIDAIYTRALEQRISQWCGVEFAERADGRAREILGIDRQLLAEASTRRSEVVAHLETLVAEYRDRYGHDPGPAARTKLGRTAALATRDAKSEQSSDAQIAAWCAPRRARLLQTLDQTAAAGREWAYRGRDQRNHPETVRDVALRSAVEVVQGRHGSWDVGLLMAAIADELARTPGLEHDAADLPGFADQVLHAPARFGIVQVSAPEPALIPLPDQLRRPGGGSVLRPYRDQRYTTVAQLSVENGIIALAAARNAPVVDADAVQRVRGRCDSAGLGHDQAAAVVGILSSGRVGDVLIGAAGTGKSRTLGALAEHWRTEVGGRVVGVATSQIATVELIDNGLDAVNTTQFLRQTRPDDTGQVQRPIRAGDLVVLDEVGMTSTADLAAITRLVAGAGAKVVFTGDPEQLAAIDAGGMLTLLAADNGAFTLTDIHRFTHDWEKNASVALREGDQQVLDVYERHGRLVGGDVDDVTDQAVRAYLADTLTGHTALLVVASNADAAELSGRIRAELIRLGRVDLERLCTGRDGNPISVGDLIQARRNDRNLGVGEAGWVTNRALYRVLGQDPYTGGLRVTDTEGHTGVLPAGYVAEDVTLGYASTVWAAQGRTVDTCHALIPPGTTRRAVYVAMTRGREANTAYVICERPADEHHHEPLASTARALLANTLTVTDEPTTAAAEHIRRSGIDEAQSLAWIVGQWDLLATEQSAQICERTLRGLLPAAAARAVVGEPGYRRLCRAVRAVELDGHEPDVVLTEAIGQRALFGADSISDVLRWRIHTTLTSRTPEHDTSTGGWAASTAHRPGPIGEYLVELGRAADIRQHHLGQQALHTSPDWAVSTLGPVPEQAADQGEWARRAGSIAAYRQLASIPDTATSLGGAPSREQPLHRRLWQRAVTAAGTPADALDYTTATDQELRQMRATYQSALAWAPAYVNDELRDARLAATGYRTDAILWAAEADLLAAGTPARERADTDTRAAEHLTTVYTRRAEQLATVAAARQSWHERTEPQRTRHQFAGDELVRRGIPRDPTPEHTDQLALLAPDLFPWHAGRTRPERAAQTAGAHRADTAGQLMLGAEEPGTGSGQTRRRPTGDALDPAITTRTIATQARADEHDHRTVLTGISQIWADIRDQLRHWSIDATSHSPDTSDGADLAHRRRTYDLDLDLDRGSDVSDDLDLGT
jgi:conjugative relaxase-like TrwC/TraI family protein